MVDDYYEDKALEEITAKGLKPGDPVGELQDTSTLAAEAAALGAGSGAQMSKTERGGSGVGMYRAGGPTTIFGGSGWGPYSDGPLNAVRKSFLNRDGLNEENWMFVAAQRTMEQSAEWARLRREALKECGGILGEVAKSREGVMRMQVDSRGGGGVGDGEEMTGVKRSEGSGGNYKGKRRKIWDDEGELPLGVYEPHSGVVLCEPCTSSFDLGVTLNWNAVQTVRIHNRPVLDGRPSRTRGRRDAC